MDIKEGYNSWAEQYDSNANQTRDLEAVALRNALKDYHFERCLEMGCGTGKNSVFLSEIAQEVVAVDFSEAMLAKAKAKIIAAHIQFIQADILQAWDFLDGTFDLVSFSLVLEHLEQLSQVFEKLAMVTNTGSLVYIGELHPFKQYAGSKARFDSPEGQQVLTCFNHHLSDFAAAAQANGFNIIEIKEYFDADDRRNLPRILSILFVKL
jgi:ubiquinone/menaquinone biosynthesis C-methylase UbiE